MRLLPDCGFIQAYGSAETHTSVILTPEDHRTAFKGDENAQKRLRSCGRPSLLSFAKVVNDKGDAVKPGEVGEVLLKGGLVFQGYWKKPEETAKTLRDGWCHMGDMATVDEEGYIYIIDRKNFMIITGGENVYPNVVENVLYSHPKIFQAAVLGIPDVKWGEAVKAIVVMKEGEVMTQEEVIDFCRDKMANYSKPKSVDFVDKLPLLATGKIDKRTLKSRYCKE